jgi:AcrR family transcriptional regulator
MRPRKSKGFDVKLTRAERNRVIKRRLFEAAVKVVGAAGYSEASAASITAHAGVSAGTLYNHFPTRQDLLDELLPTVGNDLLNFIRLRIEKQARGAAKEIGRFRAFFDFLRDVPEFVRILNEAELFAPAGFKKHMANMVAPYKQALIRSRDRDELQDFTDDEIEALVYMLLGIRGYLSQFYASGSGRSARTVPPYVFSAYEKLIRRGLFKPAPNPDAGRKAAET